MNSHKNAKLTARGREEMTRRMGSEPAAIVAAGFGVSVHTAGKWMSRFRQGGVEALADKSSRPARCGDKLTAYDRNRILALRTQRLTDDEIALRPGLCRGGVLRALCKLGCSRLSSLEEKAPVQRYQWKEPGQMLHLDVKRLGKIDGVGHRMVGRSQARHKRPGWEYPHVCVDDASRIAYSAVLPDDTVDSAVEFVWFAVAWYAAHGIKGERIPKDNGSCHILEISGCLPGMGYNA